MIQQQVVTSFVPVYYGNSEMVLHARRVLLLLCVAMMDCIEKLSLVGQRWFFTQFGDADLLQVLPRDVLDNSNGVVTVVAQSLLVLRQSDHAQPLAQVRLHQHKQQQDDGPQVLQGRSEAVAFTVWMSVEINLPSCWFYVFDNWKPFGRNYICHKSNSPFPQIQELEFET